ncbi:molybdopterin cofactor-binding domain-containing protein [Thalassobaculum sp.]|uniref:xanthine dehydrogenase family protein molybdopterin-binding subunit n=1 Tax=Thalassobaculum sp. TaxID=2022740 RepID=UPI0032EB1A1A
MSSIEFRKDLFANERDDNLNEVGKPTIRQDILGHVTGSSKYYDDHLFDGLLHMRCVRSPHHHARIRRIDTSAVERMEGVVRIVRPSDIPRNLNTLLSLINFGRDDEELLATKKVAYKGEPVLAIIATSERLARDAVSAVRVDWEVLPHVLDVEEALQPNAPVVNDEYPNNTFDYHERYDHQKLRFGDVETAFANADHIVEGEYQMSPIEQAPMETCGAIAAPETNDRIVCHTSTQALFFSLGTTAKLLDMPSSRLHFVGGTVGGGFGGKVDSLVEPMAVLGAILTGRPVKFMWDRAEEMQVGAPRGAERWRIKDGVMSDGRIVARSFTGFFDSGAYTRLSSYAIIKGTGHLPGPYSIPNVAANVYCVYTNRTPATAMRGFGITGVDFSIECQMDKVAEVVGMNPIDLRLLNAYRDGDMKAHRRVAKNTALIECCQVVAQKAGIAIRPDLAKASSLIGGGGDRAVIPETVTDQASRIGDRRRGAIPTEPLAGATSKGRIPAGTSGEPVVAAEPQREDMRIDPARVGHAVSTVPKSASTSGPVTTPSVVSASATTPGPSGAVRPAPVPTVSPASTTPARPSAFAAPIPPRPTTPGSPAPAAAVPADETPPPSPSTPGGSPHDPGKPFQQGVRRPGVSRFLSGTRRR